MDLVNKEDSGKQEYFVVSPPFSGILSSGWIVEQLKESVVRGSGVSASHM